MGVCGGGMHYSVQGNYFMVHDISVVGLSTRVRRSAESPLPNIYIFRAT